MTRNAAWRDVHDPLVRDLVGRADDDELTAKFDIDALLVAAQAAGRSMGVADALAAQPLVTRRSLEDDQDGCGDIVSAPVPAVTLDCADCDDADPAIGQSFTDDVDPLVIDPVEAMVSEHIRVGGLNRIRRHRSR